MKRRQSIWTKTPDYYGPTLPLNYLRLDKNINIVNKVAIGHSHMLVQCFNAAQQRELVYGVGRNMWGQLGKDPEYDFQDELRPLLIGSLENDDDIESYTITQIECGWHHSLLLVDCCRRVPRSAGIKKVIEGHNSVDVPIDDVDDAQENGLLIKGGRDNGSDK